MRSTQRVDPRRGGALLLLLLVFVSSCGAASIANRPVVLASAPEEPAAPVSAEEQQHSQAPPLPPAAAALPEPGDPELVEDEAEPEPPSAAEAPDELHPVEPHPLDGWTPAMIEDALANDPSRLGSLSIGLPSAGALLNGVQAEASELFEPVHAQGAWGTRETLDFITAAIRKVHEQFPDTPPLALGHISDRDGGPLSPHVSHQSGRDVDLAFYYSNGPHWYARATRANLDLPRTWALVRALVTETDVEMILIDHSIQQLLRKYALDQGERADWVDSLFQGFSGKRRPIVRHAPGHATHVHVRFFSPIAQESARRCHDSLVKQGKLRALASFIRHRAKRGDTLGKLAKKYRVTVQAIKAANGLRNNLIRERREYRIPVRAAAPRPPSSPLKFPRRRLP